MKRHDEFNKLLVESLDGIEQEQDKIARVTQISAQISQLESQIQELKTQMQQELEGVVGELAVSIRKLLPGVKVSLDGGRCNIGHLSHNLSFKPDLTSNLWDVEQNVSGRRFRRHHGHSLALKNDVGPLANDIGAFFRKRYKRLNEGSPVTRVSDKAGGTMMFK